MSPELRPLPDHDYVRWSRVRQRGPLVHVCVYGLVLWGFCSGLVISALIAVFLAAVGQASGPRVMQVSIWAVATFGIAGLVWKWIVWRSMEQLYRLSGTTRCTACGYELRGNTTGVCPECGGDASATRARGSAGRD